MHSELDLDLYLIIHCCHARRLFPPAKYKIKMVATAAASACTTMIAIGNDHVPVRMFKMSRSALGSNDSTACWPQ